jgi:hypothetical protein
VVYVDHVGNRGSYPLPQTLNDPAHTHTRCTDLFSHDLSMTSVLDTIELDFSNGLVDAFLADLVILVEHKAEPHLELLLLGRLLVSHYNYTLWWGLLIS